MERPHVLDDLRPSRRLVTRRNVRGVGVVLTAVGAAAGVLALAIPSRGGVSEPVVFLAVVSAIVFVPLLIAFLLAARQLARLQRCLADAAPDVLRVESDTMDPQGVRSLQLVDDAHGARRRTWRMARGAVPVYVELDPPSVAVLRSASDPALVVPFAASGFPFAMSPTTRRDLLRRLAPPLHEKPGVAASDPLVEHTLAPETPVARSLRRRFVVVAGLAAAALAIAFAPFRGAVPMGITLGFVIGLFALVMLPGWLVASRRVRVDRTGLEVAGPGSRRRLPWAGVGQITVTGWNRAAARRSESLGAVALLFGGLLAYALAARSTIEAWVDAAPEGDDELELRLRHIGGAFTDDVLPDLALFGADGGLVARFRGTLGWKDVESLLRTAAAHGVELQVG